MADYNYGEFTTDEYDLTNFHGPELGTKAPDFLLTTVAGEQQTLLDFPGDFLVLELGSITCPLFQGRREGMTTLVAKYPDISFVVLYIREAHPGGNIHAHETFNDKLDCAQDLRNEDKETRLILIDDIEGTAHAAYGSYPNAVFIINKHGCIVFRSDWNSVPATKTALGKLLAGQPAHAKSYFLPVKPTVAWKTLRRSGKGALLDFILGLPKLIWKNLIRRNVLLFFNAGKTVGPDVDC